MKQEILSGGVFLIKGQGYWLERLKCVRPLNMRLMGNAEFFAPVQSFLEVDMKLNDPDAFRLSKFFYEHNIIYAILDIFF